MKRGIVCQINKISLFFVLFLCFFPSQVSYSETLIKGKVVAVADGDTLTILSDDEEQLRIRLSDIDAPESKQPFGKKAKDILAELTFNKDVEIIITKKDRYNRYIGRIYVDDLDVNAEMIKRGGAWVYRQFSNDEDLIILELQAKDQKKGLWSLPENQQTPPWEFRKQRKE